MKKTYFVNLILLLAVVSFGIWLGGAGFGPYIDPPSLIIITLPVFFVLSSSYGYGDIFRAFSRPFASNCSREDLLHAENIFRTMRRVMWIAAGIGFFLGNIAMLAMLILENYFSGFAVAVLVLFYALILDMIVIMPYMTGIRRKLIESGAPSNQD